ncbi:MAG: hypothetical protein AB8G23_04190 [Myxococcota bacterium]
MAGALLLSDVGGGGSIDALRGNTVAVAECFDSLFEQTLLVGGAPPSDWPGDRVADPRGAEGELHSMVSAWEAATAERVLIADAEAAGACADLLLALTAWPERDLVVVTEGGDETALCSLYRTSGCLALAQRLLGEGQASSGAFMEAIRQKGEVREVAASELGLADWRGAH